MPIVLLILAHSPEPLACLGRLLGSEFDGLVHWDAKASTDGLDLSAAPRFRLIEERLPIFWGGYNMVLAELALVRAAVQLTPDFERLVLISGDCLPAITPDAIREFFADPNREFLPLTPVQNDPSLRGERETLATELYGWGHPWRFYNFVTWDDPLVNPMERRRAWRMPDVDRDKLYPIQQAAEKASAEFVAGLPPRGKLFETFYFGSQWWSLTRKSALKLLELSSRPEIIEYFRYFPVPDEHFVHTILGNDPEFLKGLTGPPSIMHDAHLKPEDPTVYQLDAATLRSSFREHGRPFVRKFDPAAMPEIASAIQAGTYFGQLDG